MKKLANLTKRKLIRLLKQRCPESVNEDTKRVIKHDFEQLRRTNRFKMEVFESQSTDGVNDIYDFIVSKDGLPIIQSIRDALHSTTISATPVFITPNKFWVGIPFLIVVNSKAQQKENELSQALPEPASMPFENPPEEFRLILEAMQDSTLPLPDGTDG